MGMLAAITFNVGVNLGVCHWLAWFARWPLLHSHMRCCPVACVFCTSPAMALKPLCRKWCNLQWWHGQSLCIVWDEVFHTITRNVFSIILCTERTVLWDTLLCRVFWLIWKKFCLNWESATPLYQEFHVCRLDYPLVAMPSSGCAGTVEQSLAHYWDSHADSSHPLVSVGVAVSDFDGRCWVMQHTLP